MVCSAAQSACSEGRTVSRYITQASQNKIPAETAFQLVTLTLGDRDAMGHMMGRAEVCLPKCLGKQALAWGPCRTCENNQDVADSKVLPHGGRLHRRGAGSSVAMPQHLELFDLPSS